ncbi:Sortilin [Taenia solium]|eukprot:TsM_000751200 transcript=TsM_000751200 gene=TsM_000751200
MVYRCVAVAVALLLSTSSIFASISDECRAQQTIFANASRNGHPIDFYYFKNDTKETIQLTWAGDAIGVIILVTMSESEQGLGQSSDIYRSIDNGKTFEKITQNLGEEIYIKRENGLQTRKIYHKMRKIYVICHDIHNRNNSLIYSTVDSGKRWKKSTLPFILNGKLKFSARDSQSNLVFTLEGHTKSLFVSRDGGITWELVLQNVQECFWSGFNVDNKISNRGAFTLSKSEDGGRNWRVILENVRKIWAPEAIRSDADLEEDSGESQYEPSGRFLYAAHFVDVERSRLQLSVSDNGGNNFRRVYLPTVVSDQVRCPA